MIKQTKIEQHKLIEEIMERFEAIANLNEDLPEDERCDLMINVASCLGTLDHSRCYNATMVTGNLEVFRELLLRACDEDPDMRRVMFEVYEEILKTNN